DVPKVAGGEYASSVDGPRVTIVEAAFFADTQNNALLDEIATQALQLGPQMLSGRRCHSGAPGSGSAAGLTPASGRQRVNRAPEAHMAATASDRSSGSSQRSTTPRQAVTASVSAAITAARAEFGFFTGFGVA